MIVDPEPPCFRTFVVPIYSAAQGGKGHIIIDTNPIEEARPPEELIRVRDAYGILIVGESMVPAYKPGDVAWVNPHKPFERDTDVVLYHVPPNGEAEAIIKSLIGFHSASGNCVNTSRRAISASRASTGRHVIASWASATCARSRSLQVDST